MFTINNVLTKVAGLFERFVNFSSVKNSYIFSQQHLKNPALFRIIGSCLDKLNSVVVFYFDIARFHEIEQVNGHLIAMRVLATFKKALQHTMPGLLPDAKVLAVENLWGDDYVVLIAVEQVPDEAILKEMPLTLRIKLKKNLKQEIIKLAGRTLEVHAGCAVISHRSGNLESQLYNAVREAQSVAKGSIDQQKAKLLHEFKELLEGTGFNAVYQPIVSLQSGCVLGWEALTRGPRDSYFHSPDVIFSFAEEVNLLYPLEKLCRQVSINQLGRLGADQKLFLNIHPRSLGDPNFVRGETIKLIKEMGLNPCNVVFEITERHCIDDFACFNKTLEYYRSQGFLVAVDDAGSGFSCLQSIAEIRPDFIKIDMSLVRGIHTNRVKRALLETFTTFAEKISCSIIAEGIEDEEELDTLAKMGVHYGQGFLIGKPANPKEHVSDDVFAKIIHLASNNRNRFWKPAFPVGSITENAVCVEKNTLVREVKEILDNDELLAGVVVADEGEPRGLVMRHLLYRHLGTQYGVPLYYKRPISMIMDVSPLVVEEDATIELVSQVAMNRDRLKLYDHIIVTKNNLLKGVVSVQNLLDTMTRIRLELARGANPLTGTGSVYVRDRRGRVGLTESC